MKAAVVTPLLVDDNLFRYFFFCRPISCSSAVAESNIARGYTQTPEICPSPPHLCATPAVNYIQNTPIIERDNSAVAPLVFIFQSIRIILFSPNTSRPLLLHGDRTQLRHKNNTIRAKKKL